MFEIRSDEATTDDEDGMTRLHIMTILKPHDEKKKGCEMKLVDSDLY